jgi:Bacterial Ig domain
MKRYLIAGVVLLALALGALSASSAQARPRPFPEVSFSPASFDYGATAVGRTRSMDFKLSVVTGQGSLGPFTTSLSGSSAFSITADKCNGKRISTNKSCTITVSYTPTAVGSDTGTLTASATGVTGASVSLSGSGFTNTQPTSDSASVTTAVGTAKTISLSGSDPDGDFLAFAIASNPTHGTLSAVTTGECAILLGGPSTCYGSVTYTPTAGYSGSDSFTFTVNDGLATSAAATVSITVGPSRSSSAPGTRPGQTDRRTRAHR